HQLAPQLPVIALTAHALAEERQRCLAAGMVAHISKPIDQAELLRTLLSLSASIPRRSSLKLHSMRPPELAEPALPPPPPLAERPLPAPVAARSTWPDLPGTDFESALTRCAGRQELLAKLLGTFAKQYSQHQSLFEEAHIAGGSTLASAAHRLKGLAANLGMNRLADCAAALEHAAGPHGEPSQITPALMALNGELAPMIGVIQDWRAQA
ncbi:MAG: Hpt domain-containing protein, partial [Paucibacter sp.]|nr:Hpt domain-containing protein [Roseateles sp.]